MVGILCANLILPNGYVHVIFIGLLWICEKYYTLSNKYKRIGDFAANTIVVKIKNQEQIITIDNLIKQAKISDDENEGIVNNYPVSALEYNVLKEFMDRKDSLGEKKHLLTYNLNMYFMKKFTIEKPYENTYEFFESILRMNSGIYWKALRKM